MPPLRRIAIVEAAPHAEDLYPEFLLVQNVLITVGMDAVICDPITLGYRATGLFFGDLQIDLSFNRLFHFALAEPIHSAMRRACQNGAVVLTPNPHIHALLAHKRNLTLLSDPVALGALAVSAVLIQKLAEIPQTRKVTPDNANLLCQTLKQLFFKPGTGHGS